MEVSVRKLLFLVSVFTLLWFTTYSFLNNSNFGIPVQQIPEQSIIEPGPASEIQPGDILLIRGNTWVDKIIKLVTRSPYSHVVGVVNPNQVVEILPLSTARFKKIQDYTGRADVFTCDRLSVDDRKKIVDYVTAKIGTSYDYNLVIWEASRYLLNWKWPYRSKDSSLCSTLWADAYRKAGVDLCPNIKFPVPGDLAKSQYLHKVRGRITRVSNIINVGKK
ncbi:hypothetical protein JCM15765_18510 [Paradesulfitobacterium aromaticivorans]